MTKRSSDYAKKLADPRWQRKKTEILLRADFVCDCCGTKERPLQVHHGFYEAGREPWEYDQSELQAVCEDCHVYLEGQRRGLIRVLVRAMPHISVLRLIGYIKALEAESSVGDGGFEISDIEEAAGFGDSLLADDMEVMEAAERPAEERKRWYEEARKREIQARRDLRWATRYGTEERQNIGMLLLAEGWGR